MSFIVIEGLDGSGKSTQLKLIKQYLDNKNIKYEYLHFPRMEYGIFGELVARFLRGDLGKINEVDPYLVGLIYAGDRNDAKQMITNWINNNTLVIVDRYIFSNMAYQGAKLKTTEEKKSLYQWLYNLEYNYYGIPKPDMSLFLDVPFSFTQKSLTNTREGDDRNYLQGKKDIHEADLTFQENVRQEYLRIIEEFEEFEKLECFNSNMEMLKPDEIFEIIKQHLLTKNII